MEIQKTIKAPIEFIFNKVVQSGLYDIRQQAHQSLTIKQLTGYEYTKTFGKNQTGRIKFDEVTEPSVYAFSTYTNRQEFHTRWELTAVDAKTTALKISETQESKGFFQNMNDKAVSFVFSGTKKKQILAILESIEAEVSK